MLYQLSYARSGGGRIRTFVGVRRQIYSLLPLATRAPHPTARSRWGAEQTTPRAVARGGVLVGPDLLSFTTGADEGTRTLNLLITNQLLYH